MSVRNNICIILNKKLKNEKILSQKEFAGKLGVSQATITKWLNGFNAPDIELIPKICEILEVSLYDIFGICDPNISNQEERLLLKKIKNTPSLKEIILKIKDWLGE